MSDKVELVAAAQVNAFGPEPAGIAFNSNFGFVTATRTSAGLYVLELEHDHSSSKLAINVTPFSTGSGAASIPSKNHIQVSLLGPDSTPADSAFSITVQRIRD